MASSNVSTVVNHFPTANEGFTTTLASTILSGAATVPLNSASGLTNGAIFVGIIEPGGAKEQTFTGTVDTAGAQITGVKWTRGTNADHTAGVTIVDYVSGTGNNMITKGILVEHNQDGTHDEALIQSRTADTAPASGDLVLTSDVSASNALKKVTLADLFKTPPVTSGTMSATDWKEGVLPAVSSVTNNGNRSYDITFASTVASLLSPGMRLRTTRTVTAPTYMGGLFNGSSHYFTKVTATSTLSTVTDNFTLMAWVEPTAYADSSVLARSDAAVNNCFELRMSSDGRVGASVSNGGVANNKLFLSYQSIPLNKKSHVAVTWATGTILVYIDGVLVPSALAASGGTAPNTAGTGGDFSVGRRGASSGLYFPGYISGVGVFNAVLTASTIRSYSGQVLSGSETNCIGAWSLNNTGVNQQAAGTNDLTATGGVSYTVRSPYGTDSTGVNAGTTDYALVMKVSTTTATVQVPEGCTIPTSGGVSAVAYSTTTSPFGFTLDKNRWVLTSALKTSTATTSNATYGAFSSGGWALVVPTGQWNVGWQGETFATATTPTYYNISSTALTGLTATQGANTSPFGTRVINPAAASFSVHTAIAPQPQSLSASATYVMYTLGATTASGIDGTGGVTEITAIPSGI